MKISIRQTRKSEFYYTEFLTREAFWNLYKPGCDEHLVLHNLRKSHSYIPELDLVALFEEEIIGHIITTRAIVYDSSGNDREVLCVGPLSVLPENQKKGTGGALLEKSIAVAKKMAFSGMILYGNPDYYHRYGFQNAGKFEISTKEYQNFEAFMALELSENSLEGIKGRFYEDRAFAADEDELNHFELKFPCKEKRRTDTQLKN